MREIKLDELEALVASEAETSGAPKYACVQAAFERCILSGRFKPGARVPSEVELSRLLPVGLGTVQRALGALAERGLIVRCRKTGTFIADRTSQPSEAHVYRFKDPLTGEVLLPFTRVLRVQEDDSDGPWRISFKRRRLIRIDRLVWVEQDPPAHSSVYVAYHHGAHLLKRPVAELHGSSWHRLLRQRFNLPTLRMEHRFSCAEIAPEAARALLVPPGTFGTIWDIVDFSFDERLVLFQRYQLPPGHRPIEIYEHKR